MDDNSFTLTWEPMGGSVANSGELGYTFGVYSLKPNNEDTVLYGTYVSIWKKQTDGNWKFVLQSQNEGIE
jgi:ketosteroid isomerase-like protein